MRKVNKIVTVSSLLILTTRSSDVTKFPINIYRHDQYNNYMFSRAVNVLKCKYSLGDCRVQISEFESQRSFLLTHLLFIYFFFFGGGEGLGMVNLLLFGTSDRTI